MKNPDEKSRLEIAAYREAAHAMACYLLHKRFKYVTINRERMKVGDIPPLDKISASYSAALSKNVALVRAERLVVSVGGKTLPVPTKRELRLYERERIVFLAGMIAEPILSGKCEFADILPFLELPLRKTKDGLEVEDSVWRYFFIDAKLLIWEPRNWKAVVALAEELITKEKIGYHETRKIIRKAIGEYNEGIQDEISTLHYTMYAKFVKTVADRMPWHRYRTRLRLSNLDRIRRGS